MQPDREHDKYDGPTIHGAHFYTQSRPLSMAEELEAIHREMRHLLMGFEESARVKALILDGPEDTRDPAVFERQIFERNLDEACKLHANVIRRHGEGSLDRVYERVLIFLLTNDKLDHACMLLQARTGDLELIVPDEVRYLGNINALAIVALDKRVRILDHDAVKELSEILVSEYFSTSSYQLAIIAGVHQALNIMNILPDENPFDEIEQWHAFRRLPPSLIVSVRDHAKQAMIEALPCSASRRFRQIFGLNDFVMEPTFQRALEDGFGRAIAQGDFDAVFEMAEAYDINEARKPEIVNQLHLGMKRELGLIYADSADDTEYAQRKKEFEGQVGKLCRFFRIRDL